MGDVLLLIYRNDQRSHILVLGHVYVGKCCWCHVLLQFGQHNLSLTCLWFRSKPQLSGDARENRWTAVSAQRGTQLLPASLTVLQLQRSCFRFRYPFTPTGQVRYWTVILSCHMQEVWGERSCCWCFSPSPLKGIKGTALDAICTVRGKLYVSGFGCSSKTVYRVWAENGKDSCHPGPRNTGGQRWEVFVRCFCHLLGSSYF